MKYEVGQKVMVIVDRKVSESGHEFHYGQIVRVRKLDSDGLIDSCEYLDGHDYWYIDQDEVTEVFE